MNRNDSHRSIYFFNILKWVRSAVVIQKNAVISFNKLFIFSWKCQWKCHLVYVHFSKMFCYTLIDGIFPVFFLACYFSHILFESSSIMYWFLSTFWNSTTANRVNTDFQKTLTRRNTNHHVEKLMRTLEFTNDTLQFLELFLNPMKQYVSYTKFNSYCFSNFCLSFSCHA